MRAPVPQTNPSHLRLALLSSDIWLKSARTRSRMITLVMSNLAAGPAKVVTAFERVGDAAWRTALRRRVSVPLSGWMPGSIAM